MNALLTIIALNFEPGSHWQFIYNGFKIQMIVKDDALMKKIDEGERFGKGDAGRLTCKIVWGYAYNFVSLYKKILIVLLLSATWSCSCGSHKTNMKQETSIETESNHQRKDTASFSEQVQKTEHEDMTETVEEVTTVYDTSQPVDSITGRPPVLSETKKTTKRESNKQSQEDKVMNLNQSSINQSNDSTRIRDKKDETKHEDETTVPRHIGGVIWAIVVLGGVIIVGWLIYKRRNKQYLCPRRYCAYRLIRAPGFGRGFSLSIP